jgi:hypothetical protein
MDEDWWPRLLAHIPGERPWSERNVVVAESRSIEEGTYPGERRSITILVPVAEIDGVSLALVGLDHEVSSSGPNPVPDSAPTYRPEFWVSAIGLPRDRYEPLVLSWTSHDKTVLAPDPGFLMTYGLVPRSAGRGATSYDDPQGPVYDIVQVGEASVWTFPTRTASTVTVVRDYLQDYLTLRGMALVQVFYEIRWGTDDVAESLLGSEDSVEARFADRRVQVNRAAERGVVAQVWGARVLAVPGDLPVTADPVETVGLEWPGFDEPVTFARAQELGPGNWVYVEDAVLGAYEGTSEFQVFPESGAISFGTQWGVGNSERIGRDLIRLELGKLYEGARGSVIRHWHSFAVAPPQALLQAGATRDRNIADRARDITMGMVELGERLGELATALEIADVTAENFVGLKRRDIEYRGWWTPAKVEPVTRHVPLDLKAEAFLERCVSLSGLVVESLSQRDLRRILLSSGVPTKEIEKLGGLKLLNLVVSMAQVSDATGLPFNRESAEAIWMRLKEEGTDPDRPIEHLFALYDIRNLGAHSAEGRAQKLTAALERFGIEPGEVVGGYGRVLDKVYDRLAEQLASACQKTAAALNTR